ncbi:hypothetical protein [Thiorhodococcus minor]|uniref:Uncharacterized protein n=1 Tax=Thiorhodococcus minor TaxID=57489 RepID=A0A6M0JXP8_9GAMM|nr:hypothetical protein [Thiorhodococcus minor]NEV61117.1 hypothetical protein [Thiorhodococcus minor]
MNHFQAGAESAKREILQILGVDRPRLEGPRGRRRSARAAAPALLVSLTLLTGMSGAQEAPPSVLRAVTPSYLAEVVSTREDSMSAEPFVTRSGGVQLQSEIFLPEVVAAAGSARTAQAASLPSSLAIELFPDVAWVVDINAASQPAAGILSLNGRITGSDLATFSMTVTRDSFLMTVDAPGGDYRYRVVGETASGLGEVQEIDRRLMGPVYHLPPRIPPVN